MKSFIVRTLVAGCIVFTAMYVISLPFAYIFSGPNEGLDMSVGMLVAGVTIAALQGFWFSGVFLKRTRYSFRLAGFAITCVVGVLACGWLAGWFPRDVGFLASFLVVFLVIFGLITLGYSIYFRKTAGSYQQALDEYHRKAEKNG